MPTCCFPHHVVLLCNFTPALPLHTCRRLHQYKRLNTADVDADQVSLQHDSQLADTEAQTQAERQGRAVAEREAMLAAAKVIGHSTTTGTL
eukprot:jgi/Chrzof1/7879/Cz02g39240.t1